MTTIAVLIGSLRHDSYHAKLADHIQHTFPHVTWTRVSIGDVPFFNEDVEREGDPDAVQQLKAHIRTADGVLILTPEYNGSVPGVLKNALDWASRPAKDSVFLHKRVGIIGATPGMMGTIVAQLHARHILEAMRASVVPHDALHISRVHELCERANDPDTFRYVDRYVTRFIDYVNEPLAANANEQSLKEE